jgi:hypothetical protein
VLARCHTELALRTLSGIASTGKNESARVSAATELLNRGWGRAQVDDADREGIVITIRKILEGAQANGQATAQEEHLLIEAKANKSDEN